MSLVWVTNLSAPYRRPVWAALARRRELWVGLLGRDEPNRRWTTKLPSTVRRLRLRTKQFTVGSSSLYVLLRRPLSPASPCQAVILPGWENPAAWQLLVDCTVKRVATVAFYESTEQSRTVSRGPVHWVRSWFFRHVGSVITVGASSTAAIAAMGVEPRRVITTHNSVDLDVFRRPQPHCVDAPDRSTRFAYVGQLIARKNVSALIEALARCPPAFTLDVVGEGPSRAELEILVRRAGLASRVTFRGYLPPEDVCDLLANIATLVLPSTREVHGLAPAEAMAMGLHAVVSARAGIAADLATMPGAWVSEPDPDALAAAMQSSSLAWAGPITDPPIRAWTPERFADAVVEAVDVAANRRRRPRRR